ncbi:MAG TPA: c-type cytochrome [Rhodanobacter sp.]
MKKHHFRPGRPVLLMAALLACSSAASAAEFSVCIDKSSPTAPMDTALAHAVATQEGSTLKIRLFDGNGDDDGFDLKEFNKLAKTDCSLVLGFPIDADAHDVPAGLQATTPYGHTGFVLVTPKASKASTLDQLPRHSDVAVTYQTTPNLYFVDHPGVQADVHMTDTDTLKALEHHAVSAAMVWQPTVVRYLASRHEAARFAYHELDEPHAQFNLVALYDGDHAAAAETFDKAIAALADSGRLSTVLAPYAQTGEAAGARHARTAWLPRSRSAGLMARSCGAGASKSAATPALYTAAQADSGKQKFMDNCAQCHGPTLEGRAGPALKGANFAPAKANFHVGDIFTIVSQNMPATEPGTLPHQDYVEIMAFLLQQNGYPAGSEALTFDEAKLSKVKLIYRGE